MARKPKPFQIVRYGSGFTPTGPTPDKTLGSYGDEETARRAFARMRGPRTLLYRPKAQREPGYLCVTLDHAIV